MKPATWRALAVALGVSICLGAASLSPVLSRLDGLSVDLLFWLRHAAFGPAHEREDSRVAIIAIDEETYRRPPFKDVPKAMWTPELADVLRATLDAGAAVVGQDVILPTSVEPFLPGFDRDYLIALREGGRDGRIVLGQVQHLAKPIGPFRGHTFAVGGGANIRIVNLFREADGIIRRIPVSVTRVAADGDQHEEASFAVELAARAMGVMPAFDPDGDVLVGDRRVPANDGRGLLVNFSDGGVGVPVYSFADLAACIDAGNTGYFEQAFDGKVVILGAVLDVEDRKLTSARYVAAADGAWFADRCRLPVMKELYDPGIVRETIPAAFIFATAVNNILRAETLSELSMPAVFLIVTGAAILACWATLSLPLATALASLAIGAVLWVSTATVLFRNLVVVPLIDPIAVAIAAFAIMIGYRFAVADRARRQAQQAFSYYLPPAVVERMIESDRVPELGGETREVTIYLSDIAGFTSACEGLSAAETVRMMNIYFNAASETIEAFGGCVYMYIGDAVVAVFGAPLDDPDHARHAVEAALAFRERVGALGPMLRLHPGRQLHVRTGIATGPALIGNIGSSRRFNYTAMGDTVNLAARLESANKFYGTDILISGATAARLGAAVTARPIERVRVQGRDTPVDLYEPMGIRERLSPQEILTFQCFEKAAGLRDRHEFAAARELIEGVGNTHLTKLLAGHLARWELDPPEAGEVPVFNLLQK